MRDIRHESSVKLFGQPLIFGRVKSVQLHNFFRLHACFLFQLQVFRRCEIFKPDNSKVQSHPEFEIAKSEETQRKWEALIKAILYLTSGCINLAIFSLLNTILIILHKTTAISADTNFFDFYVFARIYIFFRSF